MSHQLSIRTTETEAKDEKPDMLDLFVTLKNELDKIDNINALGEKSCICFFDILYGCISQYIFFFLILLAIN